MNTLNDYASSRIRNEKSAAKIALLLNRYQSTHWCQENIATHVALSSDELSDGIKWMRRKKYIEGVSVIFLTITGMQFVQGLAKNAEVSAAASASRFRTEALTGVREHKSKKSGYMVSERSRITAAALPSPSRPITRETPEDQMMRRQKALESKRNLAKKFGITMELLEKHVKDERVRYCKSCDSIQLFDKKTDKRWQPVCKKCRKNQGR